MLQATKSNQNYPELLPFSKLESGNIFLHNNQKYQKLADSPLNRGTGFNAINLDNAVAYFLSPNTVVQTGLSVVRDSLQEADLKTRIAYEEEEKKFGSLDFGDVFTVPTLLREVGSRKFIPGIFIKLRTSGEDGPNALHLESASVTHVQESSRVINIDHLNINSEGGHQTVISEPYYPEIYEDMFEDKTPTPLLESISEEELDLVIQESERLILQESEGSRQTSPAHPSKRLENSTHAPKHPTQPVSPNAIHSQLEELTILVRETRRVSPFVAGFFILLGVVIGKFM